MRRVVRGESTTNRIRRLAALLLAVAVAAASGAVAAVEPINTLEKRGLFGRYKPSGIAIGGYDTVAYFTRGEALRGEARHGAEWRGATWHFASAEHRAMFVAEPERYAPAYGGYCAYGVALDMLVKVDPERWTIVDGELYLNYDADWQAKWERDRDALIERADARVETLLAE